MLCVRTLDSSEQFKTLFKTSRLIFVDKNLKNVLSDLKNS